jgi:hypothetical protein
MVSTTEVSGRNRSRAYGTSRITASNVGIIGSKNAGFIHGTIATSSSRSTASRLVRGRISCAGPCSMK